MHRGIAWSNADSGALQGFTKSYRPVSSGQSAVGSLLDGVLDRAHERVRAQAVDLLALCVDQGEGSLGFDTGGQCGKRQDRVDGKLGRLRDAVRGRDADPQPGEATGADSDRDRIEVAEAQVRVAQHAVNTGHQLACVPRRLEQPLNRRLDGWPSARSRQTLVAAVDVSNPSTFIAR
jgi:hypothetical protein